VHPHLFIPVNLPFLFAVPVNLPGKKHSQGKDYKQTGTAGQERICFQLHQNKNKTERECQN
jgi:hypothetical protein